MVAGVITLRRGALTQALAILRACLPRPVNQTTEEFKVEFIWLREFASIFSLSESFNWPTV
jgi:hypothetical protein